VADDMASDDLAPDDLASDDELLAELAGVLDLVDAPPPDLVRAAKGLFALRTLDAELAELVHDSVEGEPAAAGVRTGGQPRILTFEADGLTVEIEVDETPGARRLVGQLTPPGAAALELRTPEQTVHGDADDLGRFVLALAAQRLRSSLTIRRDGAVVETSWVVL
jgi:hypothetical protein